VISPNFDFFILANVFFVVGNGLFGLFGPVPRKEEGILGAYSQYFIFFVTWELAQ
jgi:hypothetical protein